MDANALQQCRMFHILIVLAALAQVTRQHGLHRRCVKNRGRWTGASIFEPLKMKMWHVFSCAQRPVSPPGFLSNLLQRFRGSLKSDHLDGMRHLRGGRMSILRLKTIYMSARAHTHKHTRNKTPRLSFDIAGLFVMTHVAASQVHTLPVKLPWVICAAAPSCVVQSSVCVPVHPLWRQPGVCTSSPTMETTYLLTTVLYADVGRNAVGV